MYELRKSKRKCACGCGKRVNKYIFLGGLVKRSKFVRGHHTKENRFMLSEKMKAQWEDGTIIEGLKRKRKEYDWYKDNMKRLQSLPNLGYLISKALRGKKRPKSISKGMKKLWSDPEWRDMNRKNCLAALTKHPNKIEAFVKEILDDLGVKYKFQAYVDGYIPDFLLPKSKIIIECDGDYWHTSSAAKKRDARKDRVYNRNGYDVIRIPFNSTELRVHRDRVEKRVRRILCHIQIK